MPCCGADAGKLPAPVGVDLGEQGYVVATRRRRCCRATRRWATSRRCSASTRRPGRSAETQAYYAALKTRYKAEIKAAALRPTRAASARGRAEARAGARYNSTLSTVAVAQLVESRIVIPVVVGSSPISHPKKTLMKSTA